MAIAVSDDSTKDIVFLKSRGGKMRKNKWMWYAILSTTILPFQNCGQDLTPLKQSIQMSNMYGMQTTVDKEALPRLLSEKTMSFWEKNKAVSFASTPLFADINSVILAVDKTATGPVYSMSSGAGFESAIVSVNNNLVRISHMTDSNNYSFIETKVPAGSGNNILIAASFGTDPADMSLLINGLKQYVAVSKVGNPGPFAYLQKTIETFGVEGKTKEVMVYTKVISDLDLNVLSRYMAKNSSVSQVTFDPSLMPLNPGEGSIIGITRPGGGGGTSTNGPSPKFLAARTIIDTNCMGCHSSANNGDFRNLSEAQFIQKGYATAKNLAASKIYYRLNGSKAGPGPADMPRGGALSVSDVDAIAAWINGIGDAPTGANTPPVVVPSAPVAPVPIAGGSSQFAAAKAIIDNNCIGCHSSSNNGNFKNLSEAQFLQNGLVVSKNLAGSKIYYRLVGATTGPGPANMPDGGALSANEVDAIALWINSIP